MITGFSRFDKSILKRGSVCLNVTIYAVSPSNLADWILSVFAILLIVSIGLIIDYFRFAKKYNEYKKPTKVVEKNEAPVEVLMSTKKSRRAARMSETEQPKITLDAEIEKNKVDLSAKEKLGLINKKTVLSSSRFRLAHSVGSFRLLLL